MGRTLLFAGVQINQRVGPSHPTPSIVERANAAPGRQGAERRGEEKLGRKVTYDCGHGAARHCKARLRFEDWQIRRLQGKPRPDATGCGAMRLVVAVVRHCWPEQCLIRSNLAGHAMTKQTKRPRRQKRTRKPEFGGLPAEDRAAEAATVAWTVSVTAVLMTDLAAIAAHFYRLANPESKPATFFEAIMLLTACVIGLASLALLLVVWRVRQVKPPVGFAVFAVSVAVAPVLVVAYRLLA
jgi:hypothetical protein